METKRTFRYFLWGVLVLLLAACSPTEESFTRQDAAGGKLQVVATTSIVADIVRQVGGELVEVTALLPPGTDPHSYEPTPQDIARVSEAQVVFANGAGLEEFLDQLIESAGAQEQVVHVSEGIDFIESGKAEEHENEGEEHEHEGADPHTWTDPNNVMIWVDNIQDNLSQVDPANAAVYQANASAYQSQLEELDAWIREQVKATPEADRKIVTDHQLFTYFADEYGFEQVGAIVPGYSTGAQPSAKELAELEDAIRELGVPVVLVGNTVNSALAERVAEDTGTKLVFIYTGSLSDPGGEADSYLAYIRHNVQAILEGLR